MAGSHPTWQEIVDAVTGETRVDATVLDHLEGCAECASARRELEGVLFRLLLAGTPEPDPDLVARVAGAVHAEHARGVREALVEGWAALRAKLGDRLQEVTAVLAADSALATSAVRGQTQTPRVRIFETARYSVSISRSSSGAGKPGALRGQLMPREDAVLPQPVLARLEGEAEPHEATVSSFGEFEFSNVPAGDLTLLLAVQDGIIRVAPIPDDG